MQVITGMQWPYYQTVQPHSRIFLRMGCLPAPRGGVRGGQRLRPLVVPASTGDPVRGRPAARQQAESSQSLDAASGRRGAGDPRCRMGCAVLGREVGEYARSRRLQGMFVRIASPGPGLGPWEAERRRPPTWSRQQALEHPRLNFRGLQPQAIENNEVNAGCGPALQGPRR